MSLQDYIGKTPLVPLEAFSRAKGLGVPLLAKIECFNPGGSVKDRAARYMINAAEKDGSLRQGGAIVEPTSGNTGVGLAWIAAARGYKLTLTMPESMSVERRLLLSMYGAELVLTPAHLGMSGAVERALIIAHETGAFMPDQFSNPANALAHEMETGPEILAETTGEIGAFVAGVGTGGTITGVGRALRRVHPCISLIAVEPDESPVLSGGASAPHGIMGIGAGFVPRLLDVSLIDGVERVTTADAISCARLLAKTDGLFAGISSGAALCAAARVARRMAGKVIVTLLPDTGERYLSTPLAQP